MPLKYSSLNIFLKNNSLNTFIKTIITPTIIIMTMFLTHVSASTKTASDSKPNNNNLTNNKTETLSDAQILFDEAVRYVKYHRYEEAILKFRRVINEFPYSSLNKQARLKIADTYFESKDFAEAQSYYQLYLDRFPRDKKHSYVLYQLAESIYKQMPRTKDRDLSDASAALYFYTEFLKHYPKHHKRDDAFEKREKIFNLLAEKELYIANFYYRTKKYKSALGRYTKAMARFAGMKHIVIKALEGAIKTTQKMENYDLEMKYTQQLEAINKL